MDNHRTIAKALTDFFLVVSLFITIFFLYHKNLSGFWRYDDTQILLQALKYPWWKYFFSPDVWQTLSTANLTPWVTLSFDVDLQLFGLSPFGFYFHHLCSVAGVAVATYFLLSLWLEKHWAFLGALLFILGAPVEVVTHKLMTRHYIEGLSLTILSVFCLVRYTTTQKYRYVFASVVFYGLASSAKEIYVPLAILFLFLQHDKIRFQFRKSLPVVLAFSLAALSYVLWRHYMLPGLVSGYAGSAEYFSPAYLQSVVESFGTIPRLLAGRYWIVLTVIYSATILSYCFVCKDTRFLSLGVLIAILILFPLIPLVKVPGIVAADRYLLLVWFVISFSFTYCISRLELFLRHSFSFVAMVWVIVFSAVFSHAEIMAMEMDHLAIENDVQMRFAWEKDQRFSFIPSEIIAGSPWMLSGLYDIKTHQNATATLPKIITDAQFLEPASRVYEYDPSCCCMLDINSEVGQRIEQSKKMTRGAAPLSLNICNKNGYIQWEFGPYIRGQYRVVSRFGCLKMPVKGSVNTVYKKSISFRLFYKSSDGWKTYSPLLTLPADGIPVFWKRTRGVVDQ